MAKINDRSWDDYRQDAGARRGRFTPDDLLRLAHTDATVHCLVTCWRRGEIGWEDMLLQLVMHQHQQLEAMRRHLTLQPEPIFIDRKTGEIQG